MKFLLIIIVAGGIYVGMNWEEVSAKLSDSVDSMQELKDEGDDLHEKMSDKMDDAKDKIEGAKNMMNDLLEKAE